jgi:hypothetical protein
MKKLYILLIALALVVVMIMPVSMVSADPGEELQAVLDQYNLAVNPDAKAIMAGIALAHPGCACRMVMAYASLSPAGAIFAIGPTGEAGTPVLISIGGGKFTVALI